MTYILGGWQSDFSKNWARDGMEIADGFSQTLHEGLASVDLEPADIDVGHVGNFVGELFVGQGLLGGFFAQSNAAFDGLPTSRHEAACASGSNAILAACADIEAGAVTVALDFMAYQFPVRKWATVVGAHIVDGKDLTFNAKQGHRLVVYFDKQVPAFR